MKKILKIISVLLVLFLMVSYRGVDLHSSALSEKNTASIPVYSAADDKDILKNEPLKAEGIPDIMPEEQKKENNEPEIVVTPQVDKESEKIIETEKIIEPEKSEESEEIKESDEIKIPQDIIESEEDLEDKEDESDCDPDPDPAPPEEPEKVDPKYTKYVMMHSNPYPTPISALKTNLQFPSFVTALQEGEEIEFKAESHFRGYGGGESDRCLTVIDNYQRYLQYDIKVFNLYDESFFEDNAVIVIHYIDRFTNVERSTQSLTIKDGRLCIYVKNTFMGDMLEMVSSETHIIISKEDLGKIRDVVVYEEKIETIQENETVYLPEYIDWEDIYPA